LSEQMTFVQPRVSTLGKLRTIAFFCAIFFETSGDDSSEALRDGGNSKSYSNLEVVDRTLEGTLVSRIPEVANVDDPDENADDGDDLGECVTKVVELTLQRRLLADLRADALVDVANRGLGAGVDDDGRARPVHNGRAGEKHVRLVLLHRAGVLHGLEILADGLALAGKDGLVDPEVGRCDGQEASVGRDLVADGDGDDITRHEILGVDAGDLTITEDLGLIRRVFFESL
jgi:hypothetical protein